MSTCTVKDKGGRFIAGFSFSRLLNDCSTYNIGRVVGDHSVVGAVIQRIGGGSGVGSVKWVATAFPDSMAIRALKWSRKEKEGAHLFQNKVKGYRGAPFVIAVLELPKKYTGYPWKKRWAEYTVQVSSGHSMKLKLFLRAK